MTIDNSEQIIRDADPNYWLAIINGVRFGGFKSEDDVKRFAASWDKRPPQDTHAN